MQIPFPKLRQGKKSSQYFSRNLALGCLKPVFSKSTDSIFLPAGKVLNSPFQQSLFEENRLTVNPLFLYQREAGVAVPSAEV